MCGICGVIGVDDGRKDLIRRMCDSIKHRGPDDEGYYHDARISLGHRRLSIIDLDTGSQPMHNEDQSVWIVYNGEIYNYAALREELLAKGHCFTTQSDTEVIVHLYEELGEAAFARLNGIFAVSIWDVKKNKLVLARDHFGVKPLHYYTDGKKLLFCSEVKGILQDNAISRKINRQSLHYFLNLRYVPGNDTLLDGIKRLPPAHYLVYQGGAVQIRQYWRLSAGATQPRSDKYYADGIFQHLNTAVQRQQVSDVPLGVYLSGGLDSSAITGLAAAQSNNPINTFSLGFNEPTDELDDARAVAAQFGTQHHESCLSLDPLKALPEVIWHAEEPKVNILQGYLLAGYAREQVKVVLGGLGGDELFAGYDIYSFLQPAQKLHTMTPHFMQRPFAALSTLLFTAQNKSGILKHDEYRRGIQMLLSAGDPLQFYLILRNVWDYDKGNYRNLYAEGYQYNDLMRTESAFRPLYDEREGGSVEKLLWTEFHTKMVNDFLLTEDRVSMGRGLEARVPFLDKDLVEFAFSIPAEAKLRNNDKKFIFKQAMSQMLMQQTLKKKKWGFTFSSYHQFTKDLRVTALRVLDAKRIEEQGIFNTAYIQKILNYPPHPRLRWHYFVIWMMVGFQYWYEMFINGKSHTAVAEEFAPR